MIKTPFIINSHTHCFTIEHVPNKFTKTLTWFSWLLTIKWIIKHKFIRWVINFLNKASIKTALGWIAPSFLKSLPRLLNFAEFYNITTQEKLIKELQSYYPTNTKFVLLTMDMEYMSAGLPIKKFQAQIDELARLKRNPDYKHIIYPFVFADPRRPDITSIVITRLEDTEAPFQGIKLYPALGYYPFDIRLKEIYSHALENETPIITHCIRGAVYYRGKKSDNYTYIVHPYTEKELPFKKPVDFTVNFTHPYNYECLLNPQILRSLWNDPEIDLSNLKLCLGHFGGEDEWLKYIQDSWRPDKYLTTTVDECLDVKKNVWYDETSPDKKAYSWFSIICELIRKYPNVYADISYMLCEERVLPLLKVLLETDNQISPKVLFGTDFYVVSKAGAEREMSLYVRGYLGEELFRKIAYENPKKFLNI